MARSPGRGGRAGRPELRDSRLASLGSGWSIRRTGSACQRERRTPGRRAGQTTAIPGPSDLTSRALDGTDSLGQPRPSALRLRWGYLTEFLDAWRFFSLGLTALPPAHLAVPAIVPDQVLPGVRDMRGQGGQPVARREHFEVPFQDRVPLRAVEDGAGRRVVPELLQRERRAQDILRDCSTPLGFVRPDPHLVDGSLVAGGSGGWAESENRLVQFRGVSAQKESGTFFTERTLHPVVAWSDFR